MNKQSGSAIFIILIAIALFAALGFAFMRGNRGSTAIMTDEAAKAYASEMISYGNDVKSTVKRLMLRGCKISDISFENDTFPGIYTNVNNPPDSCKIFHQSGGGLQVKTPPKPFVDNTSNPLIGKYIYLQGNVWHGNGTTCYSHTCSELIMVLNTLDEKTCAAVNKILGYKTAILPDTDIGGIHYTGTFTVDIHVANKAGAEEAIGKSAACFYKSSNGRYVYAAVLHAR